MRAWVADMSANLVAGLLTVLVAYVAGRRFWDRRVAGSVQTYVEEFHEAAGDRADGVESAADDAAGAGSEPGAEPGVQADAGLGAEAEPGVPVARRLHVRNGSNEMIFDPRLTFWAEDVGSRSEPFRDADGRPITYLLPGQSWSEAAWRTTDTMQPVVISFKTGRNRSHVKGVAEYERAGPLKLLVDLGAFLLLTLLFGGLSRLLLRIVAGIRALRWWGLVLLAAVVVAASVSWLALR